MATQPYLRTADDGTYELVVPAGKGRIHVLPYCFHTEEDAIRWLSTRKGRQHIENLSARANPMFAAEHATSLS